MPKFQIITIDGTPYTEGSTTDAFSLLGIEPPRLQRFEHEGNFLVLYYSGGFELLIPEARVRHIAARTA